MVKNIVKQLPMYVLPKYQLLMIT